MTLILKSQMTTGTFNWNEVNDRLDLNSPLSKNDIIAERSGVRPLVVRRQSRALKNID